MKLLHQLTRVALMSTDERTAKKSLVTFTSENGITN